MQKLTDSQDGGLDVRWAKQCELILQSQVSFYLSVNVSAVVLPINRS